MAPSRRILLSIGGFVVGILVASTIAGIVVASTDWELGVPATIGSELGRTASQVGQAAALDDHRMPTGIQALLNLPLWAGLVGAPLLARRRGLDWVRDLGWGMNGFDVWFGLALGVAAQFALVPLYELVFIVFGDLDVSAPARSIVAAVDSPLDVIALVAMTVIAAPVAEEICYRGLLYRGIRDTDPDGSGGRIVVATVVSSLVFAISHVQLVQLPGLFFFGVVAAVVTERTGRLGTAIWCHVGFNLTTVILLLT